MEAIIEKQERLTGLALCKKMMEEKRKTQKQMRDEWESNPEKNRILNELLKRNVERGTPVVRL